METTGPTFADDIRVAGLIVARRPNRLRRARRADAVRMATNATVFFGSYLGLVAGWFGSSGRFWFTVAFGIGAAVSAMQLFHDAIHASPGLPPALRLTVGHPSFFGVSAPWWRAKHNGLHHRYTNVADRDDDLDLAYFRLDPSQPWRPAHRFQPILLPLCFPLLHASMVGKGIRFAFTGRVGPHRLVTPRPAWTARMLMEQFAGATALVALALVWHGVTGVVVVAAAASLVAGTIISLVFVVEHTAISTSFADARTEDWHERQVRAAVNVAMSSRWSTWLVGGLNHHIEHHLFPRAPQSDLPDLAVAVRLACERHGIPYVAHPTWRAAWVSHLRHVAAMSRPAVAPVGEAAKPAEDVVGHLRPTRQRGRPDRSGLHAGSPDRLGRGGPHRRNSSVPDSSSHRWAARSPASTMRSKDR